MNKDSNRHKNKRAQIIWRYGLVTFGIILMAIAISYSAVKNTVVEAHHWNAKAEKALSRVSYEKPRRGDILADDGTLLATTLKVCDIAIDYRSNARNDTVFVQCLDSLCDSMAHYYPIRSKEQWREFLAKPLAPKREARKTKVILKGKNIAEYQRILKFPFFNRFRRKYAHGLTYFQTEARLYPYGEMATLSIGRCNTRMMPRYEGKCGPNDSIPVLAGYSGLEYALNDMLAGEMGTQKLVPLTRKMDNWVQRPAVNGLTLRTTINIEMQDIVEGELKGVLQQAQAKWGTCLLMEVATGDIKAISNLELDPATGQYIEARNYAVQAYEPGSVMKVISMVPALEDGYAFPLGKTYPIGRSFKYAGGKPITDTHSPAYLEVNRFIEYSSNIGMAKLICPQYENNLNGFRDRLASMGFFDRFGTGIHGERKPYFPTLDPKAGGRVSLSRMAYGYSTMIPPLYTCAFYNAVANKGKFVRPRIVKSYIHPDGTVEDNPISYVRDSICSQRNAKILLDMIHSVVYGEGGTAKTLRNDTVHVIGKTGTCIIANETKRDEVTGQIIKGAGGYNAGHYRLSFCGIFPYEDPKYTCITVISDAATTRSAAQSSGRVVKNVAMKMYSHGMLGRYADYKETANPGTVPTLYASAPSKHNSVKGYIGSAHTRQFKYPDQQMQAGKVPNVIGLGLRDALALIEDGGYVLDAAGTGFAAEQDPPAGTPAPKGQKINVRFKVR